MTNWREGDWPTEGLSHRQSEMDDPDFEPRGRLVRRGVIRVEATDGT